MPNKTKAYLNSSALVREKVDNILSTLNNLPLSDAHKIIRLISSELYTKSRKIEESIIISN
jgi:hypothetical protein